jgi:Fe2+ transport system protein B
MFHREAGNKKYTIALVLSTTIAAWFLALIAKHITSIIL